MCKHLDLSGATVLFSRPICNITRSDFSQFEDFQQLRDLKESWLRLKSPRPSALSEADYRTQPAMKAVMTVELGAATVKDVPIPKTEPGYILAKVQVLRVIHRFHPACAQ